MIVLPADHHVDDATAFRSNLTTAINLAASQECLVTIGVRPNGPVTAYGYIELGPEVNEWRFPFYPVTRFTEKPDPATARSFVDSGRYFWNAGIFVWKVKTILQALERFMPASFARLRTIARALGTESEEEVLNREYRLMDKKSIDYGVLERAQNIFMVPATFGWDDVGSWQALGRVHPRDQLGNVAIGPVVSVDTRDCIIYGGGKLVATLGISDLVIVDTDDALLVCHKSRDQEIKRLLDQIERSGWRALL
jgi:mannose-1-phosphate guanylyltransferase